MKTVAGALLGAWCLAVAFSCSSGTDDGTPLGDSGAVDDTGGAETMSCGDTDTDKNNCGSCGNVCAKGACCDGKCVDAECSFAVTNVDPPGGWQNGGDFLTLHGHGFAKGMRVDIGSGAAPVRVIDDSTARIVTPPGPIGAQDVVISNGSKKGTLSGAFTYSSGGIYTPWQQKPLAKLRGEDPGVAVMQDGRVLIAGGTPIPDSTKDALSTAEIFTRGELGKPDVLAASKNDMSTPRLQNAAVTLLDGRVLVIGACRGAFDETACTADATSADLFDPKTDTFTPSKSKLSVKRSFPRAVLMIDGRVLIASAGQPDVDVYDPDADTFTKVAHTQAHDFGFMVRLRDGRVLLGGGDGGVKATELFLAETNSFKAAGPLNQGRSMLTAHTLPSGNVMVIGGVTTNAGAVDSPLDSIEIYDPTKDSFAVAPFKLTVPRSWHASALVRDGSILVMGGYAIAKSCMPNDTVDQIDPVKATVMPFAKLPNTNTEWNAVTLLDGSVLGVGGGACGASTALPDLDFLPGGSGPM